MHVCVGMCIYACVRMIVTSCNTAYVIDKGVFSEQTYFRGQHYKAVQGDR